MDAQRPDQPVVREDGKVEFGGRTYAIAEGARLFGLPGWPLSLKVVRLSVRNELNTFGAGASGDIRPKGTPSIRCTAQIDGYRSTLGVLGVPQTASNRISVTLYPMQASELDAGDDWSRRAKVSWPLNAIWRRDPPEGEPQIDVVAHVPPDLLDGIAQTTGSGRLAEFSLVIRLERAFVVDRERPNGAEDEPAWLAPFTETGRQPGPNLGYVSSFWIKEKEVLLRTEDDDDVGHEVDEVLRPQPTPMPTPAIDLSPILSQVSSRLGLLIALVAVLVVATFLRR